VSPSHRRPRRRPAGQPVTGRHQATMMPKERVVAGGRSAQGAKCCGGPLPSVAQRRHRGARRRRRRGCQLHGRPDAHIMAARARPRNRAQKAARDALQRLDGTAREREWTPERAPGPQRPFRRLLAPLIVVASAIVLPQLIGPRDVVADHPCGVGGSEPRRTSCRPSRRAGGG
jgi:hypothetical protein